MPAWAVLSTWSIRTSDCWTRCWVFSTSCETESTFLFTSPTSRCTYDFFAQPAAARATPAARSGTIIVLTTDLLSKRRASGRPSQCWTTRMDSRRRHVAAARADGHALARGHDRHAAEAGGARRRGPPEAVLVLELGRDVVGGGAQPLQVAHPEGDPAGEARVARQRL